ncbi:MAG: VCBS repeat-containing protein [Pseudomonadota bacterium]
MTLILTNQFKLSALRPKLSLNFVLMSCMAICTIPAFSQGQAQAPLVTNQDELFKELYRLPIPQDVLKYPWMSSVVDYDNDGSLDVILYGHHSSDAFIWRGAKGDAEYLEKGSWVFGVRDPIWFDADNDGDIDGVGTEGTGITNKLFINEGNGDFTRSNQAFSLPMGELAEIAKFLPMPSHIPPPKHPLHAKLTKAYYVDLNNDGQPELIPNVAGQITFETDTKPVKRYSGYSWVFEQKDGVWTDVTESLGLREGLEQQFYPEDIDMDGDLDLVDFFTESLYRNDGYSFTKVNTAPIFGGRRPYDGDGEIDVIDLDNNGYRDFIFGGDHTTSNGVYLNTGNFAFKPMEGSVIRAQRRHRKFADLDSDGDIDMVAYDGKEMVVYDNVTTNPGIYVKFAGDYFGTRLQVKNGSDKLVFNTQLFQHQTRGMSQVYLNSVHVGGVEGPVQLIINDEAPVSYTADGSQ